MHRLTTLCLVLLASGLLESCALDDPGPAPPRPRDATPSPNDAPPDAPPDAPWAHVDPFVIAVRPTALRIPSGGSGALAIVVEREPGFDAPVAITPFGLPRGARMDAVVAGPGDREIVVPVEADAGAQTAGPRPFALSASAEGVTHNLRLTLEIGP